MSNVLNESQVNNKYRDLVDKITQIDMHNTPVKAILAVGKPIENTLIEWPVAELADVNTDAVPEGVDVTSFESNQTETLQVYPVKKWRTPAVTTETELQNTAGIPRGRQMARQVSEKTKELMRDMESIICAAEIETARKGSGSPPAAANQTRSLGRYIQTAAQAVLPIPADYRATAGQINTTATASFTLDDVTNMLKAIWGHSGTENTFDLVAGADLVDRIDLYANYLPTSSGNVVTKQANQPHGEYNREVRVISTRFGRVNIHVSDFISRDVSAYKDVRGFLLNRKFIELRYGKKPSFRALQDGGAGPRGIIETIFALCVKNPKTLGKFAATA